MARNEDMNSIETIICLILLLMAVPDLCGKLGRPSLANVCFVVFGLALGPLVQVDVATMIKQAGEVGFLLVLFEVGLEIDLPKLARTAAVAAVRRALVAGAISHRPAAWPYASGLSWPEGCWRRRR